MTGDKSHEYLLLSSPRKVKGRAVSIMLLARVPMRFEVWPKEETDYTFDLQTAAHIVAPPTFTGELQPAAAASPLPASPPPPPHRCHPAAAASPLQARRLTAASQPPPPPPPLPPTTAPPHHPRCHAAGPHFAAQRPRRACVGLL